MSRSLEPKLKFSHPVFMVLFTRYLFEAVLSHLGPWFCLFFFSTSLHFLAERRSGWKVGPVNGSCTMRWRHEGFNKSSWYLHFVGWHPILLTSIPPTFYPDSYTPNTSLPWSPSSRWCLFSLSSFFTISVCTLTQKEAASSGTRKPEVWTGMMVLTIHYSLYKLKFLAFKLKKCRLASICLNEIHVFTLCFSAMVIKTSNLHH